MKSLNVTSNLHLKNEVKRLIENKKFKKLNEFSPELNKSIDNSMNNDYASFSPITNKYQDTSYLSHSFDLNYTQLYEEKSEIIKEFEELDRIVKEEKKRDKKNQVKSIQKELESQNSWQMYNSLIFSNPIDLPETDLFLEENNHLNITKTNKTKDSTSKRKA